MTTAYEMLIDGSLVAAGGRRTIEVIDPSTEEPVGTVPVATAADLDRALEAVERAWRQWRETDAWTRSAVLRATAANVRAAAGDIAATLTAEAGKPLGEARAEVLAAADQFDWFADEARRIYGRVVDGRARDQRLVVLRQAIGPVAAFTAWNFPALLPARKIAPAIAAGCSIIVKPAEEAPLTLLAIARCALEAGLPAGVCNVVTGDPAMISEHLLASPVVRKVSLTGSIPVGRRILALAAERIVPVATELGGHAPVLVFADADLEVAIERSVTAKFRNCGQVCIAPSRFYVQEQVLEPFLEGLAKRTAALRVGDPRDASTEVGPLSSARRRDAVEALIADALGGGATLAAGGRRCDPNGAGRGFFFEPTVLGDVEDSMAVMRDEPFGPIAPVSAFTDLEDGLARANATSYGLAGYVFTNDLSTAFEASEGLESGIVGVNNLVVATAEAPFGGIKQSGYGRESGAEGIEQYLVTKYVNLRLAR
ncbi:MAG TPA: NAD-dependent succinate-semialdehyde dehydrogenase [Acidimicrobiales bacterium]|nr:NAD-dependent succinate-semialdehyde dehydrogenase [Acidimicrobiales bacterium]